MIDIITQAKENEALRLLQAVDFDVSSESARLASYKGLKAFFDYVHFARLTPASFLRVHFRRDLAWGAKIIHVTIETSGRIDDILLYELQEYPEYYELTPFAWDITQPRPELRTSCPKACLDSVCEIIGTTYRLAKLTIQE